MGPLLMGVEVGAFEVAVAGSRGSAVIVGTGDERTDCRVAIRFCGWPVAGMSMMICSRISSSIGGTVAI